MPVYFIQAADGTGPIKIGKSIKVHFQEALSTLLEN